MNKAIQSIMRLPQFREVSQTFHDRLDHIARTIIDIQQIPAPTFDEKERAAYIQKAFLAAGCDPVSRDELHNVYARLCTGETGSAPLIISAHSDTVFPRETTLTVRSEGTLIHGPGIGDNSAGVAGLLLLAEALQSVGFRARREIWLVANVGEEGLGNLRGMRAVVDRFGSQATYIVIEGGLFGQISHRAIGVSRFRLTVETPGGHSWGDFGRKSAIHQLSRLISEMDDLPVPQQPKTTYNIGVIEGGTSINTIAQRASCLLDCRSENPRELRRLVTAVRRLVDRYNRGQVSVRMEQIGQRPAGFISRDHHLVRLAAAALRQVGCNQIGFIASSTDANIPLSKGIEAICIGLAESHNAHRLDEYIDLEKYPQGMTQLLLLVFALAAYIDEE